jgi:hypothetical protein
MKKLGFFILQSGNYQLSIDSIVLCIALLLAVYAFVNLYRNKVRYTRRMQQLREQYNRLLDEYKCLEEKSPSDDYEALENKIIKCSEELLRKKIEFQLYVFELESLMKTKKEEDNLFSKKIRYKYGQDIFDVKDVLMRYNIIRNNIYSRTTGFFPDVSEVEILVLALTNEHYCAKDIANLLKTTPNMVHKHRTAIRKKLGIKKQQNDKAATSFDSLNELIRAKEEDTANFIQTIE